MFDYLLASAEWPFDILPFLTGVIKDFFSLPFFIEGKMSTINISTFFQVKIGKALSRLEIKFSVNSSIVHKSHYVWTSFTFMQTGCLQPRHEFNGAKMQIPFFPTNEQWSVMRIRKNKLRLSVVFDENTIFQPSTAC